MGLIVLFVRVVLAIGAVAFAAWFGYVMWLGLVQFFKNRKRTK